MLKRKKKNQPKEPGEIAKEKIHEGVEELIKIVTAAKDKFDKTDDKTKKKIVAGVVGSIALIAGAIGASKLHKTFKNRRK